MKARLYRSSHKTAVAWREYRVVCRGIQVGWINRTRDKRSGKSSWYAVSFQSSSRDKSHEGFTRRGDAKRWIVQNQTEVKP